MNFEKSTINLKSLEVILANNKITDYLSTLSTEELLNIKRLILCDDIIVPRIDILSAVNNAIEYRFLEQFISLKDAGFVKKRLVDYNPPGIQR